MTNLTVILIANVAFLLGAYIVIKLIMGKSNRGLKKIIAVQDQIAAAPVNLDQSLQVIVDRLMEITGAHGAVIELVEGDDIFYRATSGNLAAYTNYRMKFVNTLSGYCIAYGEIINCPDTEKDSRVNHEATRKLNIRSMVISPLFSDGETIGVLKVASEKVNAFDKKDVEVVKLLSSLIGPSIAQKQDYEANKALLDEQIHLHEQNKAKESPKVMQDV